MSNIKIRQMRIEIEKVEELGCAMGK